LVVIILLFVILLLVFIYFWNYYEVYFKSYCISEKVVSSGRISCESSEECVLVHQENVISGMKDPVVREAMTGPVSKVLEASIICDGVCKYKQVKELEGRDSCYSDEKQIEVMIKSKYIIKRPAYFTGYVVYKDGSRYRTWKWNVTVT